MKTAIPLWDIPSLPVTDSDARFPIRRVFCVGRNYVEHQKEMGSDGREQPFFFAKAPHDVAAVAAGELGQIYYPPMTSDYHWETEMVVAVAKGGYKITADKANEHVFGYGVGLDMTCSRSAKTRAAPGPSARISIRPRPWDRSPPPAPSATPPGRSCA